MSHAGTLDFVRLQKPDGRPSNTPASLLQKGQVSSLVIAWLVPPPMKPSSILYLFTGPSFVSLCPLTLRGAWPPLLLLKRVFRCHLRPKGASFLASSFATGHSLDQLVKLPLVLQQGGHHASAPRTRQRPKYLPKPPLA